MSALDVLQEMEPESSKVLVDNTDNSTKEGKMVDSYVLKSEYDKVVAELDTANLLINDLSDRCMEAVKLLGYNVFDSKQPIENNLVADLLKETVLNLEQNNATLSEQRDSFMQRFLNSQRELLTLKDLQQTTDNTLTETKKSLEALKYEHEKTNTNLTETRKDATLSKEKVAKFKAKVAKVLDLLNTVETSGEVK